MIVRTDGIVIGISGKAVGRKDKKGYVLIRVNREQTVKRCVLVAKEYLNWFEGCEVHHKNEVRDDDRIENLEVLTPFQHRLRHNRIRIIGRINNNTIDRVYNSISDAELDNGLPHNHSHINEVLSGGQDKCGGYGWISLEYSDFLPIFATGNVADNARLECFALIYNALLAEVRDLLPLQAEANLSKTGLESIFKGFHFQ